MYSYDRVPDISIHPSIIYIRSSSFGPTIRFRDTYALEFSYYAHRFFFPDTRRHAKISIIIVAAAAAAGDSNAHCTDRFTACKVTIHKPLTVTATYLHVYEISKTFGTEHKHFYSAPRSIVFWVNEHWIDFRRN